MNKHWMYIPDKEFGDLYGFFKVATVGLYDGKFKDDLNEENQRDWWKLKLWEAAS